MRELKPEQLRRICDPDLFDFETTAETKPSSQVIAQERAVAAIRFALKMRAFGYNLYVAGAPGTGKASIVNSFVAEEAKNEPAPADWCYVNNFKHPDRPRALELPAGRGKAVERDMQEFLSSLSELIPKLFEGEDYAKRREQLVNRFVALRDSRLAELERKAKEKGFVLQSTSIGLVAAPASDGTPLGEERIKQLSSEEKREIAKRQQEIQKEMEDISREIRQWEKQTHEQIKKLDREVSFHAVGQLIEELKEVHQDCAQVKSYLDEVGEEVVNNLDDFKKTEEKASPLPPPTSLGLDKYRVNVLVDNAASKGAPVIFEPNPSCNNLFGRLEKRAQFGTLTTNFTMIKPGALHRANGGYLILNITDLLKSSFSWDGLKRAIKNSEIPIEDLAEQYGFITTQSLRPEPIPLKAKVILIGPPYLYRLLYALDEDFRKIFKVKADFDTVMEWSADHLKQFALFVKARCEENGLRDFHKSGVAAVVEYAGALVEDQARLSARFSDIADVIREASFWAGQDDSRWVTAEHVEKAVEEKRYRSNLVEEKIRELISRGDLLVDVAGQVEGQVNGLSVYQMGDFAFGRPVRITATTAMGRTGLVDIDRESNLSGNIHTKGVMILRGYLAREFAQDKPLALSASICFEQSYEEVDGDSASSAELYALLSSLSGCPIRQDVAVTGSVNQKGEIQPVGGINQKIEGFFDICQAKGVNGQQGVIIPAQNVKNLMLKRKVVEAVSKGQFHIYPVATIDEGLEILTGTPAGKRLPEGTFEQNSVSYRVDRRLRELVEGLRKLAPPAGANKTEEASEA